jgi:hypothetical protein
MKRSLQHLILFGVATALAPASAAAQANQTDSDQITATAVVATPIAVTGLLDLDFGTVMPSFGRTILVSDATAGHFQVDGSASAEISLAFSILPTDLTDGVNNLPVAFTALHNTIADPTGGTTFTPSVGVAATNLDATTGQLHVYVGGTVTAAANQVAGSYSAQVELTAAYTGN